MVNGDEQLATETVIEFQRVVRRATGGHSPYRYQEALAESGLPELLAVPTGSGKTMAAVLPWLFRRRFHSDASVRLSTPRRLVFVLPMRVLAEQTLSVIQGWLRALDLDQEVGCHLLLGGEPRTAAWRMSPTSDMVIIGTLDMIVSRALNRGYGESRYLWPIDFGLFNADCHFVFDEIQLMGPALGTSRQLHGLRERLGAAIPCGSTWMSATVPEERLATFDAPTVRTRVELTEADQTGPLHARLFAPKFVAEIEVADPKRYTEVIAAAAADRHRPGTLTVVVLNTVDAARGVHRALQKLAPGADVVLLHSRFRPEDRRRRAEIALRPVDPEGPGRIVISTQVIEAGVDISARLLITEAAPWPSIIQRAGRCNRDGQSGDAELSWVAPPKPGPYEVADVVAAVEALRELEGSSVTPQGLRNIEVAVVEEIHPVLRRKDLLELFDTLPDLSGNDIDVSRFIRKSDDLDVSVAWRQMSADGPDADEPSPGRDERCPVSVAELRKVLKDRAADAWRFDHLDNRWVTCRAGDVRPGMVVLLRSSAGCYTPDAGWDPKVTGDVEPVSSEPAADDRSSGDDPASRSPGSWVSLRDHLADTERAALELTSTLTTAGLSEGQRLAAIHAARLHDVGKAHPVFQESLRRTVAGELRSLEGVLLAKSGGLGSLRHSRKGFRHELASALMLLGEGAVALEGVDETDLVVYLVAAHHGRVRIGFRPSIDDRPVEGRLRALGVDDGETVQAIELHSGELPASTIDLSCMALGDHGERTSWSARALALRDRPDLGPFRLGFLEAVVRLADWTASAAPSVVIEVADHA
jgi:CRISPR-associated endonuclease/helicase Cas3